MKNLKSKYNKRKTNTFRIPYNSHAAIRAIPIQDQFLICKEIELKSKINYLNKKLPLK